MSYKTKRVFIKNANGTYTEISYEEFRRRKAADKSFKKRKFVRVFVDTLMEADDDLAASINLMYDLLA